MAYQLPDDQYALIKAKGYTMARQNFPFGYCEMYKNYDTGHCLYFYDGQLRGWSDVKVLLADTWQPLSWEDQAWYRNNVKA